MTASARTFLRQEPLHSNKKFLGIPLCTVQSHRFSAFVLNVHFQVVLQIHSHSYKGMPKWTRGLGCNIYQCMKNCLKLPGKCCITLMPMSLRCCWFPIPDSINNWGDPIEPALRMTSLCARILIGSDPTGCSTINPTALLPSKITLLTTTFVNVPEM